MDTDLFKRLCEERETNATKLAEDCGLNRNTIGRWLRGTAPVLPAAYAVADRLGTDVLQLWPVQTKRSSR